jgi:predicted nucleic acid-binding protein
MIAADTAALISLATDDTLQLVLEEFDIRTTETVLEELENTAEYHDSHGNAAQNVLDHREHLTVHVIEEPEIQTSRIDDGEATCTALVEELEAEFLITDDLRALPELQALTDARVAISPIVLKALVKRDVLTSREAETRLSSIAETRDWLGAPIYKRAQSLFDSEE